MISRAPERQSLLGKDRIRPLTGIHQNEIPFLAKCKASATRSGAGMSSNSESWEAAAVGLDRTSQRPAPHTGTGSDTTLTEYEDCTSNHVESRTSPADRRLQSGPGASTSRFHFPHSHRRRSFPPSFLCSTPVSRSDQMTSISPNMN